jgi:TolA-binding protein
MTVTRHFAALIIAASACLPRHAGAADTAPNSDVVQKLEQRLDEVSRELAAMKNEIRQLKAQNEALATAQQQQALQSQRASSGRLRGARHTGRRYF